mgnify:CR=1 FL=1
MVTSGHIHQDRQKGVRHANQPNGMKTPLVMLVRLFHGHAIYAAAIFLQESFKPVYIPRNQRQEKAPVTEILAFVDELLSLKIDRKDGAFKVSPELMDKAKHLRGLITFSKKEIGGVLGES